MDELKKLLENFTGEIYDLCYEVLSISEQQDEAFEYVCKNLLKYPENGTIQIKEHFSKDEVENYESIYGEAVKGLLNTNIRKCNFGVISIDDFYKSLWNMYCTMFQTEKEKAFAFYCTVSNKAIPYQYMGKPLSMGNERFRELTEQNKISIAKIKYINRSRYGQRTERASLLLNCLEEIDDYESKVVVLSHALSILGHQGVNILSDEEDIDSLIQQIDKKIEELEKKESSKMD